MINTVCRIISDIYRTPKSLRNNKFLVIKTSSVEFTIKVIDIYSIGLSNLDVNENNIILRQTLNIDVSIPIGNGLEIPLEYIIDIFIEDYTPIKS